MTEDQFKRLLEQNNARLMEHIDARLAEHNNQLLERVDRQLNERLEQNNAALFGQLSQYFDMRFNSLGDEFTGETRRIYSAVDGIAKRLETDEQERAAIDQEQKRQNEWIGQLAKATKTRLIPEQ